jgi:hypothetical protein
MSDKVELIAAAQATVSGGSIAFTSRYGLKSSPTYMSVGVYKLELEHGHDTSKMVINPSLNSLAAGQISASPLDEKHIQINVFNAGGTAADSSFFVSVLRVRD